jgi:hypothetical protein
MQPFRPERQPNTSTADSGAEVSAINSDPSDSCVFSSPVLFDAVLNRVPEAPAEHEEKKRGSIPPHV